MNWYNKRIALWSVEMSSTTHTPSEGLPPPKTHTGLWARSRLFSSPLNILITVLAAWFLLMAVPALVEGLHQAPTTRPATPRNAASRWAEPAGPSSLKSTG